jgi:hypothetical protein
MAKGGGGLAVAKSTSSTSAVKAVRTRVQAAKENAMTNLLHFTKVSTCSTIAEIFPKASPALTHVMGASWKTDG